ncbi:multi-sensor signal transduction histidine kinase (plasmid) [Cupriavidus necator N-1]|uniref:Multi-sensor signal transduction histidine kinase n=1 Tax=Cupriavidus necator (strain ATCC 43291 / DSM 13513 / CCUG 52238 / LMG 8453 / N-1) TaxID=1042878 RepID=F8GU93_CUPNN|nr:sensor histidine kinase [Cupriavidus necator]AEI82297.1 multi-sensor signal transduction histidine kinase [Cupriavidus necator N-1]MDX6007314.1 sensor histidine kinase [Cupriavidus necator]
MLVGTYIAQRKLLEEKLLASREQLCKLSTYFEAVREEERKRIAMEIHDELGQFLTALKIDISLLEMRLELAEYPQAEQKLSEMRKLVERTIGTVRHVANHLRPVALNYGIVAALEWLTEDFSLRNDAACRLHVQGQEPTLTNEEATAFLRIAQESLTNVARHASASDVNVALTTTVKRITLAISDNGRGFRLGVSRQGYSYGLQGMSERARLLGATLAIQSAPGAGWSRRALVPATAC